MGECGLWSDQKGYRPQGSLHEYIMGHGCLKSLLAFRKPAKAGRGRRQPPPGQG